MPSPSSQPEVVHTSVYLPRPVHIALRQKLMAEGKSLSQWIAEQATAYLAK